MMPVNYNLEKLKPNGSHYLAIGFSLPFCLHLPDNNYDVKIEDISLVVQIVLEKKKRNLSSGGFLPGTSNVEKFSDRRGVHCFTTVIIYIPVRGATQGQNGNFDYMSTEADNMSSWGRIQSVKAINRLLEIYRFCTGECHIRPLTGHDVWFDHSFAFFFNELPPSMGKSKYKAHVTPRYDIHDLVPAIPDVPNKVLKSISEKLVTDFHVDLSDELLLNAHDFLDQGNFRLAVIEAETAFEAALYELLHSYFERKQIKIKEYKSPTHLIKDKPFQAIMENRQRTFDVNCELYKKWLNKVWNIRNKIVHGRMPNVTPEVASCAVQVVEEVLEFVCDRKQIIPWRFVD